MQMLGVVDNNRRLYLINQDSFEIAHTIETETNGSITSVAVNEQRGELAIGDSSGSIRLISTQNGQVVCDDGPSHARPITSLQYSPDGKKLVSGDSEGKMLVWDA